MIYVGYDFYLETERWSSLVFLAWAYLMDDRSLRWIALTRDASCPRVDRNQQTTGLEVDRDDSCRWLSVEAALVMLTARNDPVRSVLIRMVRKSRSPFSKWWVTGNEDGSSERPR